jgi:hypothetical protein
VQFSFIQKNKWIQIDLIQRWPSLAPKIPNKYGFAGNEIRNNFSYWNFSKFGIKCELKIKEALGFKIQ